MSDRVPDSHSQKIKEGDERDVEKEACRKEENLIEKHGELTVSIEDEFGNEIEVTGADCPDDDGVIKVTPVNNKYPPFRVHCTGDCNR